MAKKNIVEMIKGQSETGREVVGTVATMSLPFSPKATLTAIDDDGDLVFQEVLPDDSTAEPRIWHVNADNAELAHYQYNPNQKPCPKTVVDENGQLTVNGKTVFLGDIKLMPNSQPMSVPGGAYVLATAENDSSVPEEWQQSELYFYDVQSDKFEDRHETIFGEPLFKDRTQMIGGTVYPRYIMVKNRFSVIAVKDDDGNEHFYRQYAGSNVAEFGQRNKNYSVDFGVVLDVAAVEGNPEALAFKVLPTTTLPDNTEVVDEYGVPKWIYSSPAYGERTILDNGEELKRLTWSHNVLTVVSDQEAKIVSYWGESDDPITFVVTGEAADVVTSHPYYAGVKTVYAEDGKPAQVFSYTDGETVVHVRYETSDRGNWFEVVK